MGFPSELFLDQELLCDEIRCTICYNVLKEPTIVCEEEHAFCRSCIDAWSRLNATCPIDRLDIHPPKFHQSKLLSRLIGNLRMRCMRSEVGCDWRGPCSGSTNHDALCPFAEVACPFNPAGCGSLMRKNLDLHIEQCGFRPCPHRWLGCKFHGNQQQIELHLQDDCSCTGKAATLLRDRLSPVPPNIVFCGCRSGDILALNTSTGQFTSMWTGHLASVRSVTIAANTLYSGSFDTDVRAWDVTTGQTLNRFAGHEDKVWSVVFSEGMLYSSSVDKQVKVWDVQTGQCLRNYTGHTAGVGILAASPDALYSGADDNCIKMWNKNTGDCVRTFTGHTSYVVSLACNGQSSLLSGACDSTVREWDPRTGDMVGKFLGHLPGTHVYGLAVAGPSVYTAASDTTIKEW
eukprot:CAMPEP_0184371232 /NCGR_PEP_ID=MMETSP1089-20130417/163279_1 /TAXON_ID=38269 ORGANISM="Gloeochaete wittrockiana, Strain SAG46.84" /NCGR_SAMPLE_ID=MMETSP1089 /ASSEMBLY_ACC=CAM_ASM_000445 /LENGTH=402 /DNA_ID=CAMNT_0026713957 /DNA_START=210 /DNA_END=1415 /DNA_ORIENTATION=-